MNLKKELKNVGKAVAQAAKQVVAVAIEHSMEYVHTTVENKVKELELRYPEPGQGAWKLKLAKLALEKILGSDYVQREWDFINSMIALFVERLKRVSC